MTTPDTLARYPIYSDVPPPVRKPIDRVTRKGPKPTKLRLTLDDLQPGQYFNAPLIDFPGTPTMKRLQALVANRATDALGAGNFTTEMHQDFVRCWRLA